MKPRKYPQGIGSSIQTRYQAIVNSAEASTILQLANALTEFPPGPNSEHYVHAVMKNWDSFAQLPIFGGLYMIATDYQPKFEGKEHSHLTFDGLTVIYRGHAANVRERVMSHLANGQYKEMKAQKNQGVWSQCIKVSADPGTGGIDFRQEPFSKYRWEVVILPLRKSPERLRELAEWAFDHAYGKPICCNERSKAPVLEVAAEDAT